MGEWTSAGRAMTGVVDVDWSCPGDDGGGGGSASGRGRASLSQLHASDDADRR